MIKTPMSGCHPIAHLRAVPQPSDVNEKRPMERLKEWARAMKRDVLALWLAARDPRIPWYAKAVAAIVAAYALSPVDLIPDFVPVLGYLDDLLIVPLGIGLAIKLIPDRIMTELRAEALEQRVPTAKTGLVAIVLIWITVASLTIWLIWPGASQDRG